MGLRRLILLRVLVLPDGPFEGMLLEHFHQIAQRLRWNRSNVEQPKVDPLLRLLHVYLPNHSEKSGFRNHKIFSRQFFIKNKPYFLRGVSQHLLKHVLRYFEANWLYYRMISLMSHHKLVKFPLHHDSMQLLLFGTSLVLLYPTLVAWFSVFWI